MKEAGGMSNSTIAGVIFDMDGCLVDTESVYKIAWRQAFEKYAVAISQEQIDSWLGLGWDIIAQEIDQITENNKLTLAIRQAREAIFFQMMTENLVHLMPGALEMLDFVKKEQLVVGLASSTFQEKGQRILAHFELTQYFDFIVFGDEVEHRKPAGDIYIKAIEKSGLKKEQLLVFEDSLTGCEAAQKAELQTIWVPEVFSDRLKPHPETICQIVPSMIKGKNELEKLMRK